MNRGRCIACARSNTFCVQTHFLLCEEKMRNKKACTFQTHSSRRSAAVSRQLAARARASRAPRNGRANARMVPGVSSSTSSVASETCGDAMPEERAQQGGVRRHSACPRLSASASPLLESAAGRGQADAFGRLKAAGTLPRPARPDEGSVKNSHTLVTMRAARSWVRWHPGLTPRPAALPSAWRGRRALLCCAQVWSKKWPCQSLPLVV